jgi:anti-anti-sigma regulatory factor
MVGGDLYDVVRLDQHHLVLLIADAAGHGLSAAMLAVLFRNALPMVDADTREPYRPSQVLREANRSLLRGFTAPGLFLTAAYCLVDMTDGRVTVASAGHPPLVVQRKSGQFERLFHTGPALGLYPEAHFADKEIVLEAGDHLVLHTDGLYNRLPSGSGSPSDRVIRILQESTPDCVESGAERLIHLAGLDSGGRDEPTPPDDITILHLGVTPAASSIDNGARLPLPIPTATAVDDDVEILVGGDSQRTTLCIRGRACWNRSAAFHQACSAAIDLERCVTLDLTLCQHLDSTFLGTLHELADRAEEARVELRLQGVTPQVEELFAELGMKRVLDRMVPVMLPLPTGMTALPGADEDTHARRLRVLGAHETLAALNEQNRREFDPLLEVLRREVKSS